MNTEELLQQTIISMVRSLYPNFVINLSLNGISLSGLPISQRTQLINSMKKQGMETGIMDFVLYLPSGKLLNVELKTLTGTQSDNQKTIQSKLKSLQHNYFVVRDIQTLFGLIAEHTLHGDRVAAWEVFQANPPTNIPFPIEQIKQLYHI